MRDLIVVCKNWRPRTLQNYGTKILTKCIATCLKHVRQLIKHHDLTGFIQGWKISNSIRQISEVIQHYDDAKKPRLIFVANFEKAFDEIHREFV